MRSLFVSRVWRRLRLPLLLLAFTSPLMTCFFLDSRVMAADVQNLGIPELREPVTDEARFFSAEDRAQISGRITQLNQASQIQLAVYIPKDLRGLDIDSFSIRVVDQWKLGKADTDRGLLLLIAPSERKMRIEVGYGLEGALTDLWSKRSLTEILKPALKAGRPAEGVLAWISEVGRKLGQSPEDLAQEEKLLRADRRKSTGETDDIQNLAALLLFGFAFVILTSFSNRGRRGRSLGGTTDWSSSSGGWGSSSGGGFSGGGGGFGGGGASSDW